MTYDPEEKWWLDDSHPDAAAHREFLAEGKKKEAARLAASKPSKVKPDKTKPASTYGPDLFEQIGEFMALTVGKQITALDARVKELEERPATLNYKGVFKHGRAYKKNEAVSQKSSLWIALTDHPSGIPGDANSGWQMAEKEWKK